MEVKEKLGRLPLISLKWFTPALYKEGDADLDILSHVLTGSKSARLTRSLVIDERAVQNVAANKTTPYPRLAKRLMTRLASATSRRRFEQLGFQWEAGDE